MLTRLSLFILTNLLIGLGIFAQPIGGFVKAKIDDGRNYMMNYEITVFHNSQIVLDDSLSYRHYSPFFTNEYFKVNYTAKSKTVAGFTERIYSLDWVDLFPDKLHGSNFLYKYYNDKNELDTMFLESSIMIPDNGGYFSSPDYLPPIVYHHPAQKLSVGFLKQQELYSSLDTPLYNFYWGGISLPDYKLKILEQTGNIVAAAHAIKSSFPLYIGNRVWSKYRYNHRGGIRAYIIVDSTLTGRFNYGSQYENSAGFINVVCELGKSFNFNFDYIDGDADSVTVECYNSYAHFGSQVNYTTIKKSDTLSVSLNKLITDVMYYQLPQPVNCIVYPYKNGETKPRYFSFNLVKDFKTGLTGKLETKSTPIQLYPNPTNGLVQISNAENITSLRVINVVGQDVLLVEQPTSQLDLTSLTNGVYVVEITGQNKEVYYTKLIKN